MKENTYTILKQDYLDFFSKDITVRRKEELAKKIFDRIVVLQYFSGDRIFDGWEDVCRNLRQEKSYTTTLMNNEGMCLVYEEEDDEETYRNEIPIYWLWINAELEDLEKRAKEQKLQEEKKKTEFNNWYNTKVKPLNLTKADWQTLANNWSFVAKKLRGDKKIK